MKGIWGLAEDRVFAWGSRKNMYGETSRVFASMARRGSCTRIDRPITALHGVEPGAAVRGGGQRPIDLGWLDVDPRGVAGRGSSSMFSSSPRIKPMPWAKAASSLRQPATTGRWPARARSKAPLLAVAVFQGELYVGAGNAGLLRRSADGALRCSRTTCWPCTSRRGSSSSSPSRTASPAHPTTRTSPRPAKTCWPSSPRVNRLAAELAARYRQVKPRAVFSVQASSINLNSP